MIAGTGGTGCHRVTCSGHQKAGFGGVRDVALERREAVPDRRNRCHAP